MLTRALFELGHENRQSDEIRQYQMGRYISSIEAVWRTLKFSIHEHYPNSSQCSCGK